MKENPNNRNLLIKLFGLEWLENRDIAIEKLTGRKTKAEQLKLNL